MKIKTGKSKKNNNLTHVLANMIKCKYCNGHIVKVSGNYYGCYNAKRKVCCNKLTIARKRIEMIILNDLQNKFLIRENITLEKTFYVAHTSIQTLALLAIDLHCS